MYRLSSASSHAITILITTLTLTACGGGGGGGGNSPPPPPPPNVAPTATSASITTNVGIMGVATPSVTDPNSGDTHTFTVLTQPANGTASANSNTELAYIPNAGFNGPDSFTYRATDAGGLSVTGTATVNVVNNAPTSISASISTFMGLASNPVSPLVVDVDNDIYTYSIDTVPAHGTAQFNNEQLTYTANNAYLGTDSFTIRVTDAGGLFVTGTVNVNVVNRAPTATGGGIITNQGSTSTPITINVTDADTAQGDTHTFTIASQPSHGIARIVGNQVSYEPDVSYYGSDTFDVTATDSGNASVNGLFNVTINQVNLPPIASRARFPVYAVNANSIGGTPFVDIPDTGDTFTVDTTGITPTNGTVTTNGTQFVFSASVNTFSGADSFNYTVTDSNNQSINGTALVRIYNATNYARCTTPSTVNPDGTLNVRISVGPCAIYGETITRSTANGTPVTVRYVVMRPASGNAPKGVVMMIGGGDLNMNITGDNATGSVTTTGGNYLVRSAQLLADGGYLVVAMNRPSDRDAVALTLTDAIPYMDAYRVSVDHTVDILNVLKEVNTDKLPIFLAGTSRGAISVVANNLIANRVEISSPVTNDLTPGRLYVGIPGQPNLQLSYLTRPTYVVWHEADECTTTPVSGAQAIYNDLFARNIPTIFYAATGGTVVNNPARDVCGAFDYHGFFGIENIVMADAVSKIDGAVRDIFLTRNNRAPVARYTSVIVAGGVNKTIDVAALSNDPDVADTLSYALPNSSTVLGGAVSISGAIVTYTPPAGVNSGTDYFPYIVEDDKGGVDSAVIQIQIKN